MTSVAPTPLPSELFVPFAQAGLDLQHYAALWRVSEENALRRASSARARTPEERTFDQRLDDERSRQSAALETVRSAALAFPDAFDAAVAESFSQMDIDQTARTAFLDAAGVRNGGYAAAVVAICERANASLRDRPDFTVADESSPPPVSGGESLACDLIVVGGMAAGATCVIGCGPCCIAGAGAVIAYVAFC